MSIRPVKRIVSAQPTMEGAGVHLHRGFGFGETAETDPFLLFDDFRGDDPRQYQAGFPWHPHRGIETITYVLAGNVEHADSLGNRGLLGAGDVQWMTAGRGIIHHEMPHGDPQGRMHGFQLWANLPSAQKMVAPRYQDVQSKDIAEIVDDDGTTVRVICGEFWGKRGPVDGIAADPQYLDVFVPAGVKKSLPVDAYRSTFAYIFQGSGTFRHASDPMGVLTERTAGNDDDLVRDRTGNRSLIFFDSGDEVVVRAGDEGIRFLLVSGTPIKEPVAWYGPIVMNTQAELQEAVRELRAGTFIKDRTHSPDADMHAGEVAGSRVICWRGTSSYVAACLALLMAGRPVSAQPSASASAAAADATAAKAPAPASTGKPKKQKVVDFTGSLGFSQTNGNANAMATNVTNKVKVTLAGWSFQQDVAFFYGEANDKVNTNFWNGGLRGDRTVAERISLFVATRYDRNVLQGIENRFQQGFGVTVKAIEEPRQKLHVALGGSLFSQQLTEGSVAKVSRAFPAARAAVDFRRQLTDLAYVQQTAEYLPAIGETSSSYFVNTESAVVAPLSKNIGLKVGYVIRYNSEPPTRNDVQLRTTDTFFSSGLTLTF